MISGYWFGFLPTLIWIVINLSNNKCCCRKWSKIEFSLNFSLDFISSSSRIYHLTHPDKTLCPNKNRLTRTVLFNTLLLALAIHINLPIKTVIHRSEVIHAGIYLSCCSYKFPIQHIYRINWEQLPQYRPL